MTNTKSIASFERVSSLANFLSTAIPENAKAFRIRGAWTQAVYLSLKQYATTEKWKIYPPEKPYLDEFLLDFMLIEEGYGVRVACESEWWHWRMKSAEDHRDALGKDFEKLFAVKGDIKVFIYEGDDGHLEDLMQKYLGENAQLSTEEAFLAIRFDGEKPTCYWWMPSVAGPQTAITPTLLNL